MAGSLKAGATVAAAVLVGTLMATVVVATSPTLLSGSTSYSATTLARGIVKNMKSTGGTPLFVQGSAALLGGNEANAPGEKYLQYGVYQNLNSSLVDSTGLGVVLASGRVTNFFDGTRQVLNSSGDIADAGYLEPWTDYNNNPIALDTLLNDLYDSVALTFSAYLPVGTLTFPFAMCTDRPDDAVGSVFDIVTITIRNATEAASPTNDINIAYIPDAGLDPGLVDGSSFEVEPYMVVSTRFVTYPKGTIYIGTEVGLVSAITYCQAAVLATVTITNANNYTFQFTASRQAEGGDVAGTSSYLLTSAAFATDYPDVYNATTAILTQVDTINEAEQLDTWCVVGSVTEPDIAPGYRVYASTIAVEPYCCKAHGLYNVTGNTCVVKTCNANAPHVYTAFLHVPYVAGDHVYDCYALCTPRSGYVDSLPQSSLLPVFKTMYDNRVQNYLALDTVSAATYAAETYDREGIYIDEEYVATTGVRLYVGTTEYICTIRGVYLGSSSAEFKCITIYSNFLYTSDQLAYAGCYTLNEV